jgi:hypothetical protein
VQSLAASGLVEDAVRFVAYSLPKREAVWWAWVCARRAAGAEAPPKIKGALDATEKWIAQPTDENRRVLLPAAEEADMGTAAGCAAIAAYLSGGSLAPPGVQAVPPAPYLTARAVASAIVLAAVAGEPEQTQEKLRASLDQGLDVVNRIKLW